MRKLGTVAFVLVVCLQIVVPTLVLVTQEPPARFGFQMYSGHGWGTVELRDVDGNVLDDQWTSELLPDGMRPELDWTKHLPERACAEVPGAATLALQLEGRDEVLVACPD